jgi:hypothetical protein
MDSKDDKEKIILKIYFQEVEYLCRAFAHKFGLNVNNVLIEGLNQLNDVNPDIINAALLNKSDIDKLNVQQLKDELKNRNLKMTGYKDDLRYRLLTEMDALKSLIKEKSNDIKN